MEGIRDKAIGARQELFRQISRMDGSLYFLGLVGAALSRCSRYAYSYPQLLAGAAPMKSLVTDISDAVRRKSSGVAPDLPVVGPQACKRNPVAAR